MEVKLIASKDEIESAIKDISMRQKSLKASKIFNSYVKAFIISFVIFWVLSYLTSSPKLRSQPFELITVCTFTAFTCAYFSMIIIGQMIENPRIGQKFLTLSTLDNINTVLALFDHYLSRQDIGQLKNYILKTFNFQMISHDKELETEIYLSIFRAFYEYFKSLPDKSYINLNDLFTIVDQLALRFRPKIQESYKRYCLTRQCATKRALKVVRG